MFTVSVLSTKLSFSLFNYPFLVLIKKTRAKNKTKTKTKTKTSKTKTKTNWRSNMADGADEPAQSGFVGDVSPGKPSPFECECCAA